MGAVGVITLVQCRGDLLGALIGSCETVLSEKVVSGSLVGTYSAVFSVISSQEMMGLFARVILLCVWYKFFIWRGEVASVDSVILGGVGTSNLVGGIFHPWWCDFLHPRRLSSLVKNCDQCF